MRFKYLTVIVLLAAGLTSAQAQTMYKCKDAAGRTLTSDRPIPECADRAVQVMGKDGLVRKEIAAPLTAEQKRKAREEADKAAADELVIAEKRRADLALTTRYRTEADIEVARTRATKPVLEQIKRDEAAVASAAVRLKEQQAAMPKDVAPPHDAKRKLDAAEAAVRDRQKSLAAREEELEQLDKKFAQTLARYREINGAK